MNPNHALLIVAAYFGILLIISLITSRNADQQTFFTGNRNSPWYLVAFGMIGASLSGVTFISVPGAVGVGQWAYFQMVLGYLVGYAVIALVLMPLYYRLNLTSIYGFLRQRYGNAAFRTGALLFLLSKVVGASLRLYLVALVLQLAICDHFGIPFEATVFLSIVLIFLYTFRGGIKTIVWTDTLQTFSMLLGAGIAVYLITKSMDLNVSGMVAMVRESSYSRTFFWDWGPANNFFKQFAAGAFIAIVMTGLDQDMMQKNLTCRTLGDAQKNMFWFSITLVFANLLFLALGTLLYLYGQDKGISMEVFQPGWNLFLQQTPGGDFVPTRTDQLFPFLSINYLGPVAGIIFLIGVIAAAYSSADSALTALTTSFCIDILDFEKQDNETKKLRTRYLVHIGFAILLFLVILIFNWMNDQTVISAIFTAAGYTYGPLLGLYAFGMFSQRQVPDPIIPVICVLSPILSYWIQLSSPAWGYTFGFEILLLNGLLTIIGLWGAGFFISENSRQTQ